MPFDGSGFEMPPVPRPEPARRAPQERVLTIVIAFVVVLLFILPVSAGTLVDIVEAVVGG